MAVHASRPRRPFCALRSDGGTRRYGVLGGRFRRSDVGLLARRAQSSGEHPGSSVTLRDGLLGLLLCVGGGASVDVPGWRACCCWVRWGRGEGRAAPGTERLDPELEFGSAFNVGGRGPSDGGGGGGGGGMRFEGGVAF